MKISYQGNILTIVTDIKEATMKKNPNLVAKDEKGNQVYRVSRGSEPSITQHGMTCNAVVDSCLAVVMTMPFDTTLDEVKSQFGSNLLLAAKYTPAIETDAGAYAQVLDGLFQ